MPVSTARVRTDTAPRYAKQLASHLGRKITAEETSDGGYRLTFQAAEAELIPEEHHLVMRAVAPDDTTLATVQNVLGSHLERFGHRNELTVTWQDTPTDQNPA